MIIRGRIEIHELWKRSINLNYWTKMSLWNNINIRGLFNQRVLRQLNRGFVVVLKTWMHCKFELQEPLDYLPSDAVSMTSLTTKFYCDNFIGYRISRDGILHTCGILEGEMEIEMHRSHSTPALMQIKNQLKWLIINLYCSQLLTYRSL